MNENFSAKLVAVTKPILEGVESIQDLVAYCARVSSDKQLNAATVGKLLKYLLKHKHFSPFEMANCVVEINCPRDIARQILRHRSFSFQEFSQRYADVSALSFTYREPRMQDATNRQNSIPTNDPDLRYWWLKAQDKLIKRTEKLYKKALERGLAKEVARVILPEGLTMSRMYVNGTIRSWIHYLEVRTLEGGAQMEHVLIAQLIAEQINSVFTLDWQRANHE